MRNKNALVYAKPSASRSVVRRQYARWRKEAGVPARCDIPACHFYTNVLVWNGRSLTPILDHLNGCKWDNRPENLRWVCPNCDAQLETRGGKNRGRVTNANAQGYQVRNSSGGTDANIFLVGQSMSASLGTISGVTQDGPPQVTSDAASC